MVYTGSSCSAGPDRPLLAGAALAAGPTVVWLRGEHDILSDGALCRDLARAIALNDAALILDLSQVEFMGASTFGVIVAARKLLQGRSRSLTVRSPPAFVKRALGICGLDDLVGPGLQDDVAPTPLVSRAAVPAVGQDDLDLDLSTPAPERVLVHAGPAVAPRAEGVELPDGGHRVTKVAARAGL
jgi:anti-anti-sigma factor